MTRDRPTIGEEMRERGISRRALLKYCSAVAATMALPASMVPAMAQQVADSRRLSVIWLSCQECTGCIESLTRVFAPTIDTLLFDFISLDYQEALQAAAGEAAEEALAMAVEENKGKFVLLVDGSIPTADGGIYSTVNGHTNIESLKKLAADAAAVVSIGTCAAYGGIGAAYPNPTGAVGVDQILTDRTVINVPGCPPIPESMAGVLTSFLTFGELPELDHYNRPKAFFAETIHDRCYRRPFYDQGKFAKSFDDEGARAGWCLYELGCKGPITHNACATTKWNQNLTFPIQSGHGCLGCSEPNFWDKDSFYTPLSAGQWGSAESIAIAAAAGAAVGGVASVASRVNQKRLAKEDQS
jgi:hydrogenase small subunit